MDIHVEEAGGVAPTKYLPEDVDDHLMLKTVNPSGSTPYVGSTYSVR